MAMKLSFALLFLTVIGSCWCHANHHHNKRQYVVKPVEIRRWSGPFFNERQAKSAFTQLLGGNDEAAGSKRTTGEQRADEQNDSFPGNVLTATPPDVVGADKKSLDELDEGPVADTYVGENPEAEKELVTTPQERLAHMISKPIIQFDEARPQAREEETGTVKDRLPYVKHTWPIRGQENNLMARKRVYYRGASPRERHNERNSQQAQRKHVMYREQPYVRRGKYRSVGPATRRHYAENRQQHYHGNREENYHQGRHRSEEEGRKRDEYNERRREESNNENDDEFVHRFLKNEMGLENFHNVDNEGRQKVDQYLQSSDHEAISNDYPTERETPTQEYSKEYRQYEGRSGDQERRSLISKKKKKNVKLYPLSGGAGHSTSIDENDEALGEAVDAMATPSAIQQSTTTESSSDSPKPIPAVSKATHIDSYPNDVALTPSDVEKLASDDEKQNLDQENVGNLKHKPKRQEDGKRKSVIHHKHGHHAKSFTKTASASRRDKISKTSDKEKSSKGEKKEKRWPQPPVQMVDNEYTEPARLSQPGTTSMAKDWDGLRPAPSNVYQPQAQIQRPRPIVQEFASQLPEQATRVVDFERPPQPQPQPASQVSVMNRPPLVDHPRAAYVEDQEFSNFRPATNQPPSMVAQQQQTSQQVAVENAVQVESPQTVLQEPKTTDADTTGIIDAIWSHDYDVGRSRHAGRPGVMGFFGNTDQSALLPTETLDGFIGNWAGNDHRQHWTTPNNVPTLHNKGGNTIQSLQDDPMIDNQLSVMGIGIAMDHNKHPSLHADMSHPSTGQAIADHMQAAAAQPSPAEPPIPAAALDPTPLPVDPTLPLPQHVSGENELPLLTHGAAPSQNDINQYDQQLHESLHGMMDSDTVPLEDGHHPEMTSEQYHQHIHALMMKYKNLEEAIHGTHASLEEHLNNPTPGDPHNPHDLKSGYDYYAYRNPWENAKMPYHIPGRHYPIVHCMPPLDCPLHVLHHKHVENHPMASVTPPIEAKTEAKPELVTPVEAKIEAKNDTAIEAKAEAKPDEIPPVEGKSEDEKAPEKKPKKEDEDKKKEDSKKEEPKKEEPKKPGDKKEDKKKTDKYVDNVVKQDLTPNLNVKPPWGKAPAKIPTQHRSGELSDSSNTSAVVEESLLKLSPGVVGSAPLLQAIDSYKQLNLTVPAALQIKALQEQLKEAQEQNALQTAAIANKTLPMATAANSQTTSDLSPFEALTSDSMPAAGLITPDEHLTAKAKDTAPTIAPPDIGALLGASGVQQTTNPQLQKLQLMIQQSMLKQIASQAASAKHEEKEEEEQEEPAQAASETVAMETAPKQPDLLTLIQKLQVKGAARTTGNSENEENKPAKEEPAPAKPAKADSNGMNLNTMLADMLLKAGTTSAPAVVAATKEAGDSLEVTEEDKGKTKPKASEADIMRLLMAGSKPSKHSHHHRKKNSDSPYARIGYVAGNSDSLAVAGEEGASERSSLHSEPSLEVPADEQNGSKKEMINKKSRRRKKDSLEKILEKHRDE